MTTLYHYIHCPFCVRVRMAFGFLKLSYSSEVLGYDNEKKPIELTGIKMLPIVAFSDITLNESLAIIKKADKENSLHMESLESQGKDLDELLAQLAGPIHNLVMPYWVYTQEFNDESRAYFLEKKEKKRGPFNKLMSKAPEFLGQLSPLLEELESKINPYLYDQKNLTIMDIMLASHLWGLYVLPEFQFSPRLHNYLQGIKKTCSFNYHEDYWR